MFIEYDLSCLLFEEGSKIWYSEKKNCFFILPETARNRKIKLIPKRSLFFLCFCFSSFKWQWLLEESNCPSYLLKMYVNKVIGIVHTLSQINSIQVSLFRKSSRIKLKIQKQLQSTFAINQENLPFVLVQNSLMKRRGFLQGQRQWMQLSTFSSSVLGW